MREKLASWLEVMTWRRMSTTILPSTSALQQQAQL
jgi:hypothetical protein